MQRRNTEFVPQRIFTMDIYDNQLCSQNTNCYLITKMISYHYLRRTHLSKPAVTDPDNYFTGYCCAMRYKVQTNVPGTEPGHTVVKEKGCYLPSLPNRKIIRLPNN